MISAPHCGMPSPRVVTTSCPIRPSRRTSRPLGHRRTPGSDDAGIPHPRATSTAPSVTPRIDIAAIEWLPTERLLEIVDEAAALEVKHLFVLGGGEPWSGSHTRCHGEAKSHGMGGILTTNGTLLNDKLIDIVEMAWDEIHFSIDGPTAAIRDKLRGQAGAFKRTVRNAYERPSPSADSASTSRWPSLRPDAREPPHAHGDG